jgi:GAF domain-containing protein
MANWTFSTFTLLVLLAALLTAGLTVVVWRRRTARSARILFYLILLATLWCFAYAVEVAAVSLETNFLWNRLKYIAIAAIPVAWLLFAQAYAGKEDRVRRHAMLGLAVIPTVTQLVIWTNGRHHLFWRSVSLDAGGRFPALELVYGHWFWIHTGFSYLCFMAGAVILAQVFGRSRGVHRRQAAIMLLGAAAPFVSNALTIFNLSPIPELDLTPLAFAVTSVLFSVGVFRFQLLDLLPELKARASVTDSQALVSALAALRGRMLELLLTGMLLIGTIVLALYLLDELKDGRVDFRSLGLLLAAYGLLLLAKSQRRLGYRLRAAGLLLAQYLLALRFAAFYGLELNAGIVLFAFTNLALALFGGRVALAALALSLLTLASFGWLSLSGAGGFQQQLSAGADGLAVSAAGLILAVFAGIVLGAQAFINGEMRRFAWQAQSLTQDLEAERRRLEARVAQRTQLLTASYAASRQIAAIRDAHQLAQDVVDIVSEAFRYYAVHIYLLDASDGRLAMVAGTGEVGRAMLAQGYRLSRAEGTVGMAAGQKRTIFTPDVTHQVGWPANPQLPETRAEAAIPIMLADELLGVLDVQDSRVGGISPEAVPLLESIAGQVAVALRNAQRLAQFEAQAAREAQLMHIVQAIQETTSIEQAMEVAVAELGAAIGAATGAGSVRARLGSAAGDGGA